MKYFDEKIMPSPVFKENAIPVYLTVSEEYFKYFCVLLNSIFENLEGDGNLDIILIVDNPISDHNIQHLNDYLLDKPRISVRFFDIRSMVRGWKPYLRGSYKINSYYRLLAPYFLLDYDKAIYLDVDTIVLHNLFELYSIDLGSNLIGATRDLAAQGFYKKGSRKDLIDDIDNIVCIKNIDDYFQAAVLLVNLKQFRKTYSLEHIKAVASERNWMYIDQDVYNYLCRDCVKYLDLKWDVTSLTVVGEGLCALSGAPREEYALSRQSPYIIHYPGEKKPWYLPDSDFALYFWKYARSTPFYEELLVNCVSKSVDSKLSFYHKESKEVAPVSGNKIDIELPENEHIGQILFRCVTLYHLFTVINLKLQKYNRRGALLILSGDMDWGNIPEKLESLELFTRILVSTTTKDSGEYYKVDKYVRYDSAKKPSESFVLYGGDKAELEFVDKYGPVSEVFFALSYHLEKYLYYHMVNKQTFAPRVHIYEEGTASYVLNYHHSNLNDCLDHKFYKNNDYVSHICELLVYCPLCITNKYPFPVNSIPKINSKSRKMKDLFEMVFGSIDVPSEKYIYFDSPDLAENYVSDGIDILDRIASVVGKENIIVKLHPRNLIDRYSVRGYKVMGGCKIPWELVHFSEGSERKCYISEFSTASITADSIFGCKVCSINIFKLLVDPSKNFLLSKPNFDKYYSAYLHVANGDMDVVYTPKTMDELERCLLLIG